MPIEIKWSVEIDTKKAEQDIKNFSSKTWKELEKAELIKLEVDQATAEQDIKIFARDTWKELDKAKLIKLEVDLAELKIAKRTVSTELNDINKQFKKWLIDKDVVVERQKAFDRISSSTTEAQRRLQNYKNTWDETLSRLQAKFNSVTNEIKKSRDELQEMWKSTKWFDKLIKQADNLDKKFKEWKISVENFTKEMTELKAKAEWTWQSVWWLALKMWDLVKGAVLISWLKRVKDWLTASWKTALDFETALAWVNKTLDVTPEWLSRIDSWLKAMTTKIPIAYTELAKIAETGWQLWVARDDILKFTETVAMIWVTTNLTSEERATNFARIANIIQEPLDNIDKMASSVVALWNNFAANEREILNFATNIAGAWEIAWLSAWDIFWISTAFTSIWIEAEAGWTAVQKALLTINTAVATWNSQLDQFAQISWKTREQFTSDWKEDAWKTFSEFVNQIWVAGDKWVLVLNELLGTDVRLQRAFLWLAQNSQILTDAINLWNTSFEENNALQQEANKRFTTTASQLEIQKNKWKLLGDFIWTAILPLFTKVTNYLTNTIPKALINVQAGFQVTWLAIFWAIALIQWKLIELWASFWVTFSQIWPAMKVALNNTIWTIKGFIWWTIARFNSLVENIWVTFWNIWVYIWNWLQKWADKLNTFFNQTIQKYNDTIWKITWEINWKVNIQVGGGTIVKKDIWKDIASSYLNAFNSIKKESASLNETIIENNLKEIASIKSTARAKTKTNELVLNQIRNDLKTINKETQKSQKEISGISTGAIQETKKKIKREMNAEAEALNNFLEWLETKDDRVAKWWKKAVEDKKDLAKQELEIQTSKLEAEALNDIERIKESNRTESEKAKKILEINERLKDDLLRLNSKDKDILVKQAEDRIKKEQEYWDRVKSIFEKAWEIQKKYKDEVVKIWDAFDELKEKASQSISEINLELEKLNFDTDVKLAEQRLKLLDEEKKNTEEINKLQKEELTSENLEKQNLLLAENKKIKEELILIEQNANKEILNQIEARSKLNDTERLLDDKKARQEVLEEKNTINEAILNGETINLEDITNLKNKAYAEDLIAKRDKLNQELEIAKNTYELELQSLRETDLVKKSIERWYTDFLKWEVNTRIWEYRRLEQRARRAIERARQAGISSNNTTNNNVNQNINVSNEVDSESLLRNLNKKFK